MMLTAHHDLKVVRYMPRSLHWLLLFVTALFTLEPQLSMDTGAVTAAVATESETYQLAHNANGDPASREPMQGLRAQKRLELGPA